MLFGDSAHRHSMIQKMLVSLLITLVIILTQQKLVCIISWIREYPCTKQECLHDPNSLVVYMLLVAMVISLPSFSFSSTFLLSRSVNERNLSSVWLKVVDLLI